MKLSVVRATFALFLLYGCRGEPIGGICRTVSFNHERRFVLNEYLKQPPSSGSYYQFMHGAFIDMVDHLVAEPSKPSQIALGMSTGADRKLLNTNRRETILHGPFGIVQLEKSCFFASHESGYRSRLNVGPYMQEKYMYALPPRTLIELPDTAKFASASLIRIFSDGENYVMAYGNYEANGQLGGQGLVRVRAGGEFISGQSQIAVRLNSRPMLNMSSYALPERLTFAEPFDAKQITLSPNDKHEVLSAFVRRYDFDRYVRVDRYHGTRPVGTALLAPVVLPEDAALNDECDAGLRRQAAIRETVVN